MSFIFCFTEPGIMLCHLEQLLLSCIVLCLVKVCASLKAQDEASVNDHDIVRRQAMGHSFGDELEGFDRSGLSKINEIIKYIHNVRFALFIYHIYSVIDIINAY